VRTILRLRPDFVSLTDSAGRTPLHICARRKVSTAREVRAAVATARALLSADANVHAVHQIQDDGEVFPATALWYALAWGRNPALAAYFLKLKADPNHCMFALVFADDLPRRDCSAGTQRRLTRWLTGKHLWSTQCATGGPSLPSGS
jgi:hypothetical protein